MVEDEVKRVLDYEGELIGSVERNEYEETRVYVRESKKGGHYVEIRRWKHVKHYDGPARPGVGLHQDEVEGVRELLEKAAERAGVLDSGLNDLTASVNE